MINPHIQPRFRFEGEIIADNFAGAGGASKGIHLATGRHPDIAVNHNDVALAVHAANHPTTAHYCESVWDVDIVTATQGQPVGLVWFSPDCRHFSPAKGGVPVDQGVRGLAWVKLERIRKARPRVTILENVPEFMNWGPLVELQPGRFWPDPKCKGDTFREFVAAIEAEGYKVEYRVLQAHHYGVPTIRKRLFMICRRDGQPIVWPEPTHGPGLLPYRTAAECIDWSLPCPSIFERKRPLADNTCRRIAAGIMRYVVDSPNPFVIKVNHKDDQFRGQGLDEPLQTVTAVCGTGLVVPELAPLITECANASSKGKVWTPDEPLRTVCASTRGGHFALVSAFMAKHYTGVVGSDLREPLSTVTATDHNALVSSHLLKLRNNCIGQDVREPLDTVATGGHFGEVRAFLMKYYGEGGQWQGLDEPMHTLPTKARMGLVMVHGEPYQIVDIGMRMLEPYELAKAQGFPDDYVFDRLPCGKKLSKEAQVRLIGNSVCPDLAKVLVQANM